MDMIQKAALFLKKQGYNKESNFTTTCVISLMSSFAQEQLLKQEKKEKEKGDKMDTKSTQISKYAPIPNLNHLPTYLINLDNDSSHFSNHKKTYNKKNRNYIKAYSIFKMTKKIKVILNKTTHMKTTMIDTYRNIKE